MRLFAIVAMSENRVIGINNQLPWHLPADLKHFKMLTMGKPILMGRKTFESIGRALPGRTNVVISRDVHFNAPGCVVVSSMTNALAAVEYSDEVYLIGGAQLFTQFLPQVERIYLTVVHQMMVGDAYFPPLNANEWQEIENIRYEADAENAYPYSFLTLQRLQPIA